MKQNTVVFPLLKHDELEFWNEEFLYEDEFHRSDLNETLNKMGYYVEVKNRELILGSMVKDNPISMDYALVMLGILLTRRKHDEYWL